MRIPAYLTIRRYAELIGVLPGPGEPPLDTDARDVAMRQLRRQLQRTDAAARRARIAIPVLDRPLGSARYQVSVDGIREHFPGAYERILQAARYADDDCDHPTDHRKRLRGEHLWCEVCGALARAGATPLRWQDPALRHPVG